VRDAIFIGCAALTFQQTTGIDSLAYFSTIFYTDAGLTPLQAQLASVGGIVVNSIGTIV
jgi:hypothetical protein